MEKHMSTYPSSIPRPPYTGEELQRLYPTGLSLVQVQIILRHGERSPTTPRFIHAGLSPYWPYCSSAKRFKSVIMSSEDGSTWDEFAYRRHLETLGRHDEPVMAEGPGGKTDTLCKMGETTDKGRATTLALGQRLRTLYVNQLRFMPPTLSPGSLDSIYLRATSYERAAESVQQTFWGFYPAAVREAGVGAITLVTRSPVDENLYDNSFNCQRFAELSRAFARRAAQRWNDSPDMDYLQRKLGKWMPESSPKVQVDSRPSVLGIMDTSSSSLAHGSATRLPPEFYEEKVRDIMDRVTVEEWFQGYKESHEYRLLGKGAMVGDVVTRMVEAAVTSSTSPHSYRGGATERRSEIGKPVRMGLTGAHDTTIAGFLAALGAFDGRRWPPFTSHIAIELFRADDAPSGETSSPNNTIFSPPTPSPAIAGSSLSSPRNNWFTSLVASVFPSQTTPTPRPLARKPTNDLTPTERSKLQNHYVRIRYNDVPVTIPGCQKTGRHLEGDVTFCTLEAFKAIADYITPLDWRAECRGNIGESWFPETVERAGFAEGDEENRGRGAGEAE